MNLTFSTHRTFLDCFGEVPDFGRDGDFCDAEIGVTPQRKVIYDVDGIFS